MKSLQQYINESETPRRECSKYAINYLLCREAFWYMVDNFKEKYKHSGSEGGWTSTIEIPGIGVCQLVQGSVLYIDGKDYEKKSFKKQVEILDKFEELGCPIPEWRNNLNKKYTIIK